MWPAGKNIHRCDQCLIAFAANPRYQNEMSRSLGTGSFHFRYREPGFGSAWGAGSAAAAPTRKRRQRPQDRPQREARREKSCPRYQTNNGPLRGPFSFGGWDQERNLVQQNALAFWTHEVRPEGARIALRRFESILPPLPGNRKPGFEPGYFFVPVSNRLSVHIAPDSGQWANIGPKGRL